MQTFSTSYEECFGMYDTVLCASLMIFEHCNHACITHYSVVDKNLLNFTLSV